MKTMLCCAFFLLVILSGATLNPLFAADEQREAYDRMVEEATREADEFVEQKQKEQHEAAQQGKKRANPEADEPVQAERKQIGAEMERVRQRGLGPNYTEGMRDNQLQEKETFQWVASVNEVILFGKDLSLDIYRTISDYHSKSHAGAL